MKNRYSALILAAGSGERLRPYTNDKTKALVTVGRISLIRHLLSRLNEAGIEDVIIVGGYKIDALDKYLKNIRRVFPKISFKLVENKQYAEYNNCYSLITALDHIKQDFIIFNSDIIFHKKIIHDIIGAEGNSLSVDNSKKMAEEEMKVLLLEGFVDSMSKYNPPDKSAGEYIGIAKVAFNAVNAIKKLSKSFDFLNKKHYYEDILVNIKSEGIKFKPVYTNGLPWTEIDTVDDLKRAREVIFRQIK